MLRSTKGKYGKVTDTEIKWSIIGKSAMIIIFVEFIDQLIDRPINCVSLRRDEEQILTNATYETTDAQRKNMPGLILISFFFFFFFTTDCCHNWPASVAQLDAPSDWRPGGRGFNPCRGRQNSFVDHEIFSTVILSGERMCTILVNCLED